MWMVNLKKKLRNRFCNFFFFIGLVYWLFWKGYNLFFWGFSMISMVMVLVIILINNN